MPAALRMPTNWAFRGLASSAAVDRCAHRVQVKTLRNGTVIDPLLHHWYLLLAVGAPVGEEDDHLWPSVNTFDGDFRAVEGLAFQRRHRQANGFVGS